MKTTKFFIAAMLVFHLLPAEAEGAGYPDIRVGILNQFHISSYETVSPNTGNFYDSYTTTWERQIYIRRIRILLGGSISDRTSFFFDTDAPNIGYTNPDGSRNMRISMYVQDAYIQHQFTDYIAMIAGLQIIGITRNSMQSAASLMALNYGSYQFFANQPLDNIVGRDLGISFRGFVIDRRLEYRAGLFSGRNNDRKTELRYTLRLNYNFLDRETGLFYTGTTLGKGKHFSIGGGFDTQDNYYAFAGDAFLDYPLFSFGSLTASASYAYIDCGTATAGRNDFSALLPTQNIIFAETGIFLKRYNLQPYLKYEQKRVNDNSLSAAANKLSSGQRIGFGINYFITSHQMNIKLLYERVLGNYSTVASPAYREIGKNEILLQIQYFSF